MTGRRMMAISSYRRISFAFFMVLVVLNQSNWDVQAQLVSGLFVFGDSLVDDGNNNYLRSAAKSNYFPYGIDFDYGTTGRFCNGKTFVDFLARLLGVPYPPAFADPTTIGPRILGGVNYASAAGGILDESGQNYGERYSLSQQVINFERTLSQLRPMLGSNLSNYLARSLAVVVIGSNDYINNYLLPYPYTYNYTPSQFAYLLLNHYARQLVALNSVGLRKFFLAGIGPLGCIPNQRSSGRAPPGRCFDYANEILGPFNEGLKSLADILNRRPGVLVAAGNTYAAMGDILNNPQTYGFTTVDIGCCGLRTSQGDVTCLPFFFPCSNRNQYVFWDAFHPTEAVNAILARRAFYGSTLDSYPFNILNMTLTNF